MPVYILNEAHVDTISAKANYDFYSRCAIYNI